MFLRLGCFLLLLTIITTGDVFCQSPPFPGAASTTTPTTLNTPASLSTLSQTASTLLRAEATASEQSQNELALTALCDFYVLLRSDPRYANSEMLRGDAAKVRRRLIKSAHHVEHRLRRAKVPRPETLSREVDAILRQGDRDFRSGKRTRLSDWQESVSSDSQSRDAVAASGQAGGQVGGQAGGAIPDNGWQLVELIQRVVSPQFWDSQGGAGTIQYYAMRRVLVVRATSDVHEQIRDMLIALGW
ncbi:hypothetical protein RMSM_01226 [Rhodopirellula maiorica SM1]|uniref:Secreted protein n=1 Tax=Rhodopirellula maiorica SM1 TaxID=1265738 RepID=M5RRL8_9BACT|nr:hypothetical protein [Rhodopirellula maiorica]EMI21841.1 hypothetical protein RMSM_01226 [Rhodopirellula maiorica SM1]